jgi:2-polyprenyl-3-methyl-5-hydroxy-6-metoxy-1,4-benzoquinol methylase
MKEFKSSCTHEHTLKQYFADGEIDFFHCSQCGIVLRQPMPTLQELDNIYADLYKDDNVTQRMTNQESGSHALKKYAQFLTQQFIVPGTRVLDYGCGTGELVEQLRASGVEASGLERSDTARQYALAQRNLCILPDTQSIQRESLDVVTMVEVIEHLTDPYHALEEIRSRLRPGGLILVTTPNRRGFRARLEGGQWREAQKKFHVVLFERESLANLLRMAGYTKIQQIRYSPVQRPGLKGWLIVRLLQFFGLPGTLCMTARVSG